MTAPSRIGKKTDRVGEIAVYKSVFRFALSQTNRLNVFELNNPPKSTLIKICFTKMNSEKNILTNLFPQTVKMTTATISKRRDNNSENTDTS